MKNKWKNYFNELKYNKFYKYYFIFKKIKIINNTNFNKKNFIFFFIDRIQIP